MDRVGACNAFGLLEVVLDDRSLNNLVLVMLVIEVNWSYRGIKGKMKLF